MTSRSDRIWVLAIGGHLYAGRDVADLLARHWRAGVPFSLVRIGGRHA